MHKVKVTSKDIDQLSVEGRTLKLVGKQNICFLIWWPQTINESDHFKWATSYYLMLLFKIAPN